ncbi:MAG: hypothetical protein DRQ13_08260 [Ignavibacteriae bacterium]|nr:MAG: hypothetical protein DRQ13_08260 [Ignavibacteriota bacterium]
MNKSQISIYKTQITKHQSSNIWLLRFGYYLIIVFCVLEIAKIDVLEFVERIIDSLNAFVLY